MYLVFVWFFLLIFILFKFQKMVIFVFTCGIYTFRRVRVHCLISFVYYCFKFFTQALLQKYIQQKHDLESTMNSHPHATCGMSLYLTVCQFSWHWLSCISCWSSFLLRSSPYSWLPYQLDLLYFWFIVQKTSPLYGPDRI